LTAKRWSSEDLAALAVFARELAKECDLSANCKARVHQRGCVVGARLQQEKKQT
jgi:hypothetical protein